MTFNSKMSVNKSIWLPVGKSFLVSVLILPVFLTPSSTQAGVISFISDLISGQDVSAQAEQTISSSSSDVYESLAAANNPNPSLKETPQLSIENGEAFISTESPSNIAPEEMDNSTGQISTYIVRSGDTVAKIAEMFDVSSNTILWANDMTKNSTLKAGQTLVILPISGVMHTVAKGDTLSTIAKKYGGDIDEIASFNDLRISAKLAIGDTVMIPDGQVSSSLGSTAKPTSSNLPTYSGYYMKPFVGGHKTQGLHGYRNSAVDYGMPVGTPLYAAAAGKVIISKNSGWNGGYGNYVIIQHGNSTQTIYGHMSSTLVSVGQTLVKGQLIGYSGNSGNSTGPHLHFEIRGAKNPF
jgi:LysM repeat protein